MTIFRNEAGNLGHTNSGGQYNGEWREVSDLLGGANQRCSWKKSQNEYSYR